MTELFGLGLFGLGLGLFGSVFGLRLIMPRVSASCELTQLSLQTINEKRKEMNRYGEMVCDQWHGG